MKFKKAILYTATYGNTGNTKTIDVVADNMQNAITTICNKYYDENPETQKEPIITSVCAVKPVICYKYL